MPPGSRLWALSGSSEQPEGFSVQVTDFATRSSLFSSPLKFANITGQGSVAIQDSTGATRQLATPLHILNAPRPLIEPGLLNVQITNQANATNQVQLILWIDAPYNVTAENRNQANAELEAEDNLWRRAHGRAAAGSTASSTTTSTTTETESLPARQDAAMNSPAKNQPFNVTALGANTIIAAVPGYQIAIHQLSLWNTSQQTIRLLDRDIDLQGPLTEFPAGSGYMLPYQQEPHFVCSTGNPFIADLSAGQPITGFVKFRLLTVWTPGGNV